MSEQTPANGASSSNEPTVPIAREDLAKTAVTPKSGLPDSTPKTVNEEPVLQASSPVQPSASAGGAEQASAPTATIPAPAKAESSVVGNGLGTILAAVVQTWKGNTVGALRAAAETKHFGWVATGAYAVIGGLLVATMLTRFMGGIDDMANYMVYSLSGGYGSSLGYFSASFSDWFTAFILGIILMGLFFILRALCVKWVFSTRGAAQPFTSSLAIIGGAYAIPMVLVLVAAVLNMIPSVSLMALVSLVTAVLSLPVGLISEIMIYIGINRSHRFTKSPLIPHALFTLIWVVMFFIATMLVMSFYGEIVS